MLLLNLLVWGLHLPLRRGAQGPAAAAGRRRAPRDELALNCIKTYYITLNYINVLCMFMYAHGKFNVRGSPRGPTAVGSPRAEGSGRASAPRGSGGTSNSGG